MIKKNIFKKRIPSFRHKKNITILDNIFFKNTKKKTKYYKITNLIKRIKFFYKKPTFNVNLGQINNSCFILKKPVYLLKPYKLFYINEDIYGNSFISPGIVNLSPGNIFMSFSYFNEFIRVFYINGNIVKLKQIPFNVLFSNVANFILTKITFSKASGTFCKIRKLTKKKKKLILITLPSGKESYLPYNCTAYVGKNTNFKINSLVEGKFGFSLHYKKKLNVRGVAMNPVDHPNGGRTKTVKPEKSPWGWVAKNKK